ncbi:MAG: OmpA family protein [Hyphomicrobiaceae bacterium]|nr:OmpA family protein [Hyphomicrobiaceae bacterium]
MPAAAQKYAGPLMPHVGGQIDYAFANRYGPDAEARVTFAAVDDTFLKIDYFSTRGLFVQRDIAVKDRDFSKTYVLGYSAKMPRMIPQSTSLGISGAALLELRNSGRTQLRLIYDEKMSVLDGQLVLKRKDIKIPLIIENQLQDVSVIHAIGTFGGGNKTGTGEFYFADHKENPMLIQSAIQFSWEKEPRVERIVRVSAGDSMKSSMEQSLATVRKYDLYGIHFDFDKTTLQSSARSLIKDIALTLKNNPNWTLQINGHTDSIGESGYNQKLSAQRAASVAKAIVAEGIKADRLSTGGFGAAKPKGDNATLEGRALNRRVELLRTDK